MHNKIENLNIVFQKYSVVRSRREKNNGHKSFVLWFTGLSGSGKSTIAGNLEEILFNKNISTYLLDGDNLRLGLCHDLSFTLSDRTENIRRVGEVSKLMMDSGLIVLVALITPLEIQRQLVKDIIGISNILEIFVDTPINICEKRDVKGLYKKFKLGKIANFTGLNSIYEIPKNPDIYINGTLHVNEITNKIIDELKFRKII